MLKNLLLCLFAAMVLGDCETSTCVVCNAMPGCGWYGFDCLNTSNAIISKLNLTASTCDTCQAGSCSECQAQPNCTWYSNAISGKCGVNGTSYIAYTAVDTCPSCFNSTTCDDCNARQNTSGCGWYVLPGGVGGKCREASPSFAYSQVPSGSCATGNPCSGILTCKGCQNATGNCSWYASSSPSLYNSKCDLASGGIVSSTLYSAVTGTCPSCAESSCAGCKADAGCKWVAVQGLTGIAFGQCLATSAPTPTAKTEIATCPNTCQVHTCLSCTAISACRWYTGSSIVDDSCDLASDATFQHPTQDGLSQSSSCTACMADRCGECNQLPTCGWYARKVGPITFEEGCYPNNNFPSGRELVPSSDSKCDGAASGATSIAASFGLLAVLPFLM